MIFEMWLYVVVRNDDLKIEKPIIFNKTFWPIRYLEWFSNLFFTDFWSISGVIFRTILIQFP